MRQSMEVGSNRSWLHPRPLEQHVSPRRHTCRGELQLLKPAAGTNLHTCRVQPAKLRASPAAIRVTRQDAAEDAAEAGVGEGPRGRRGQAGREGRRALPRPQGPPGRARPRPRVRREPGRPRRGGGGEGARRRKGQGLEDGEGVPDLPVEPGLSGPAVPAVLLRRPRQVRPNGAGRAPEDQVRAGLDAGVQAVVPGGHLRVLLHEHRRGEHGGVPEARGHGHVEGDDDHAAAAHVRGKGPRRRHDQLLPAVQVGGAVAEDEASGGGGAGARAVAGGAEEAGRAVRVHPVRVLQHGVPVLLVELGGFPRPRRAAPRIPLGLRQPGRVRGGADPGPVGGVGQAVQVQDDQELHGDVPQEPRPSHGHLRPEDHAPAPQGVKKSCTAPPRCQSAALNDVIACVWRVHHLETNNASCKSCSEERKKYG